MPREAGEKNVLSDCQSDKIVDPEGLLTDLKSGPKPFKLGPKPSRDETTQGVAATIHAVLEELQTPEK
ncbi:MAG: hypothetical protein GXX96_09755 [Planctomycetaceae bacterium]|nr:hypothetical protein [Planctomycetaceae bacterium]